MQVSGCYELKHHGHVITNCSPPAGWHHKSLLLTAPKMGPSSDVVGTRGLSKVRVVSAQEASNWLRRRGACSMESPAEVAYYWVGGGMRGMVEGVGWDGWVGWWGDGWDGA